MPPLAPILALLGGCPHPALGPGQTIVEDIRVEGNSPSPFAADSSGALLDAIEQRHTRRLVDFGPIALGKATLNLHHIDAGPLVGDPGIFDEGVLVDDARRLETWYHHHGYFDAKFLRWEEVPRRRADRTGAQRIDLVAHLERGQPSVLDADIELTGTESLSGPFADGLRRLLELHAGDTFSLDAYQASLDAVRERLHERGYAYATVTGRVDVRPDLHTVHVALAIEPGRACVFGEIAIRGEKILPESRLLQELGFEPGDGYRTSKIVAARQRLYGLGVYALVEVLPVLDTPEAREVPIEIRLQRRPSRSFAFGPSLVVEPGQQRVVASVEYRDDDVAKRLLRYEATVEGGVAATVDPTTDIDVGTQALDSIAPVASFNQSFTVPGLVGGHIALGFATTALLGVETGYREFEATTLPSLTWTPDRRIATTFGYQLKYHRYFDVVDRAAIVDSRLDVSAKTEYLLSSLEQSLTWDARDNPLQPTRNYYFMVATSEAGGPLGGDFGFFRVLGEVRGYRHARVGSWDPGTVVAVRTGGGAVFPYEAGDDIDLDERLYVGGSGTVRGWGDKRLGPHVLVEVDGVETYEPVGGLYSAYGSFELRQPLPWSTGLVLFVDGGRAWDKVDLLLDNPIQLGVGGGLRYYSAIGAIRVDVAFAVKNAEQPAWADQTWAAHLGLGEAF